MRIDTLPLIRKSSKKRIGRGYGSGKGGHTVGRGQKGQKSRGKLNPLFEGTKTKKSLLQRLPLQRGKGKLNKRRSTTEINLDLLNKLPSGATVDINTVLKAGMVKARNPVKILGNGKLEKRLKVKLPVTASAARKIKKAGGTVLE